MSMTCLVCNSTIFKLEDGATTCLECGSHQLDFIELTSEEEAWDPNRRRFFINPEKVTKNKLKSREDSLDWSYMEAYNLILKRWTDVLVKFGASQKFKDAVFKLWICYLQKRGIAFCGKESIDLPKNEQVGVFSSRDMVVLKNAKLIEKEKKIKEKAEVGILDHVKDKIRKRQLKSTGKMTYKMGRFVTSQMSETLNVVDSFTEEMEVDVSEEEEDLSQDKGDASLLEEVFSDVASEKEDTPEETTIPTPVEEEQLKIKKNVRRCVVNNANNFSQYFLILSPSYLNLEKLVSILYLGLLMAQEDILLLDVLRWCREDFIPFQSAGYLLPKSKVIRGQDLFVFNRPLPPAVEIRYHAASMAFYLSLQSLALPSIELIINKLVDSLRLPDDVRSSALHTLRCFSFRGYTKISVPPFEIAAAAAILLTFKVTYGLDDVHEEILSDYADTMNKILKAERRQFRLFSWRKWHIYMNRLMDWTDRMMVSNLARGKSSGVKAPTDPKRFNQYFWTKGIWKTPIDRHQKKRKNNSTWDSCLLNNALGLNLKKFDHVMEMDQLFQAYKTPLIGLVDQYITGAHAYDLADGSEEQYKIAEQLLSESFSSDRFNWLLHHQEVMSEFENFGRYINIVKIPLRSSTKCEEKVTKSQKGKYSYVFFVPDPLKSYRSLDCSVENLPGNFRWLLRLLSRVCETRPEDVLKQFIRMEKKYLTAIHSQGKDKTVSIAEGEIVSDLLK